MGYYYSCPFVDYRNEAAMTQPQQIMPVQQPVLPMNQFVMPAEEPMPEMEEFFQEQKTMKPTTSAYLRDPDPVLSNNPPTTRIVLFKELTGYPNYGNPSRNADILYTGDRGVWTFNIPAILGAIGNLRGQIIIRAVLDDHYNVPVRRYSARITVNGSIVHNGPVPLEHGTPAGGIFNNWRELTFNVPNFRRNNRVVIENTSTTGDDDWIAFDWMELRIRQR